MKGGAANGQNDLDLDRSKLQCIEDKDRVDKELEDLFT